MFSILNVSTRHKIQLKFMDISSVFASFLFVPQLIYGGIHELMKVLDEQS